MYRYARSLAAKAGLPTYKFAAPIRRRADRDKLDGKPCPDCQAVSERVDLSRIPVHRMEEAIMCASTDVGTKLVWPYYRSLSS